MPVTPPAWTALSPAVRVDPISSLCWYPGSLGTTLYSRDDALSITQPLQQSCPSDRPSHAILQPGSQA